jgi:hypothetical protein
MEFFLCFQKTHMNLQGKVAIELVKLITFISN